MKFSVPPKYSWLIVPILFLLFSAPGALDYVFHFPDEKYYTDAVLQMMDKGDIFTPYKADGTPRFFKPIITYWVLIGSYEMLGVSTFTSRLFFWLAGGLLISIVYFMVKSLTANQKTAMLAAFITASNPLVLMSASRSIPDILLVLFLTISAWGFLEILIAENPQIKYYWFAYLGAALAFETKGIPAAAFAGVSMLFLVLNPWKRKKVNQILEPASLITAILVALSWFIIMYVEHGSDYLSSFYNDQVGGRVSSKTMQVLKNTFLGIVNLLVFLIPWIFIVLSKSRSLKSFISASDKKTKAILAFIFLWVVLVIIMSGAVFKFYDRYLLPVIPLVSLFFAVILTGSKTKGKSLTLTVFLGLTVFLFCINILYAVFILADKVLLAGIVVGGIALLIWFSGMLKSVSEEIVLANLILLLYFNVFVLLYPLLMPNPGEQLTEELYRQDISPSEKVYVYGNIRAASNIRIHSHHKLNVVSMDTIYALPKEPDHFLVFSEKEKKFLNLKDYQVIKGSEEWKRVPSEKFPGFLKDAVQKLKESGTEYFIAKPIE